MHKVNVLLIHHFVSKSFENDFVALFFAVIEKVVISVLGLYRFYLNWKSLKLRWGTEEFIIDDSAEATVYNVVLHVLAIN